MSGDAFRLLMIGAMYENGGNTTHRLLDGHPELFVYPFESQLGTRLVSDALSSTFPLKYRWPVFDLDATPVADYEAIIDEECKVRAKTPHVSKFRHVPFEFSDQTRRQIYQDRIATTGRSRMRQGSPFASAVFSHRLWQLVQPGNRICCACRSALAYFRHRQHCAGRKNPLAK